MSKNAIDHAIDQIEDKIKNQFLQTEDKLEKLYRQIGKLEKVHRKLRKRKVQQVTKISNLKQKIILEGMVSWSSITAWGLGSTMLLAGWAVGSVLTGFLGFVVLGGGTAWSLTSLAMRYDSIKAKVLAQIKEAIRAERNQKLDELDVKLTMDKDPRDQNALRDLRAIYDEFEEFAEDGKISEHVRDTMIGRINELFEACIKNLETCYDLWETSRSLRNSAKQQLMQNREDILRDVIKRVESFTNVVTSIITLSTKNGELTGVGNKLDEELAACLRVEQRLRDLDSPEMNPAYEEYLR